MKYQTRQIIFVAYFIIKHFEGSGYEVIAFSGVLLEVQYFSYLTCMFANSMAKLYYCIVVTVYDKENGL